MNKIFSFLFPNFTCLACGDEINVSRHKNVCDICFSKFRLAHPVKANADSLIRPKDGGRVYLEYIFAPFTYGKPLSGLIMRLKYGDDSLPAQTVAPFLEKAIKEHEFDIIIPIPLSKKRQKHRGYNQAEILAQELCALGQIQVLTTALVRTRNTTPQTDMTVEERMENQKNAFEITDPEPIKGKRILLIDDVVTSGATVNECAGVLIKAGAKAVSALAVARS